METDLHPIPAQAPAPQVLSPLAAAASAAQVVPLPDDTGLGLLHLGVLPAIPLAGASQTTSLPGSGAPLALSALTELLGIELTAAWRALFPQGIPGGNGTPPSARGVPGSLLPVAPSVAGPHSTGGPGDLLSGLSQRFLPLPLLTSSPDTWQAKLEVTIKARAQPRALDTPLHQAGDLNLPLAATIAGISGGALSGALEAPLTADIAGVETEASVGPITIPLLLPTLPVPPLLIMFRGVNFEPPGLVVCPLPAVGGSLNGLLTTLGDALVKLDLIERMLKRVSLPLPLPYAGVASALQLVLKLLGSPAMRVLSTREEPNLNVYDLMLGVVNDLEAEDELRSLVYVGLPGPTVDLYPKRDFQPGSNNRFLRLGVTGEMAAQGRLVVSLSDLNERSVPGVLHPADMQHTLFWRDASSFRFQRV